MIPWEEKSASPRARRSKPGPKQTTRPGAGDASPLPMLREPGSDPKGIHEEVSALAGDHERWIRLANLVVAIVAILVLSPLIILIGIAIKLDTPGPIFYRQLRVGLDRRIIFGDAQFDWVNGRRSADLGGLPFVIYKFRTMWMDAETESGPVWARPKDGRTTRVGKFLRQYRLDEIPQFFNVLKGEMSVVGPRPERPYFVQHLRSQLTEYPLRQRVPPGITGWAQVHRRPDQDLDDVRVKLQYDLEYLRRRSLTFDLRIMLRTLPAMLEGERPNGRS